MIRLLGLEFRRYAARRAVRASGVLALLAILIAATVVLINSDDSQEAIRASERERRRLIAECEQSAETQPGDFQDPGDCEGFFPREGSDPRFHLAALTEVVQGLSFLLVIVAMGLGATFVGAEWSAGTMTTILTWEPRRVRVLTAKVLAGIAFVVISVVAALATLVGVMASVAILRGSMAGIDGAWLLEIAGIAGRAAVVCGVAAVIGMAIASIARNTAFALIVAFVYFAVLENIMRGFRPNWMPWLVGDNMTRYVIGTEGTPMRGISGGRALATLVVYAAIFYLAAAAMFRSRDVT